MTDVALDATRNDGRRQFWVTLRTEGHVTYAVWANSPEEAEQSWRDGEEVDWSDPMNDEV